MTYKQSIFSIMSYRNLRIVATTFGLVAIISIGLFLIGPWCPYSLGAYSLLNGHYQPAAKYFKQATQRDPRFAVAIVESAALHNCFGESEDALDDCNRLVTLNAGIGLVQSLTYVNRAYAYNRLGRYKDALDDCHKTFAGMFMDRYIKADVLVNQGEAYDGLKQHDRAKTDYYEVLQLVPDPNVTTWVVMRARALIGLGRFDAALNHLDKLIEDKPELPLAYIYRAAVNEKLGRHEASQHDIERAKELGYRLKSTN